MSNTKEIITIVMVMGLNLMSIHVCSCSGPTVTLNTTDLMNIFIPQGDLIGQTNFATLRASMNISTLFLESKEVCTITAIMKESLSKILKNNRSLSSSNRKIIHILKNTLENLCTEDLEGLQQLIETFNLVNLPPETKKMV